MIKSLDLLKEETSVIHLLIVSLFQNLEVEGVMRFYFQNDGERVSTKCIRVSSTATTRAVIDALVEKFVPDLRMLSTPEYSLWEVHEGKIRL